LLVPENTFDKNALSEFSCAVAERKKYD